MIVSHSVAESSTNVTIGVVGASERLLLALVAICAGNFSGERCPTLFSVSGNLLPEAPGR